MDGLCFEEVDSILILWIKYIAAGILGCVFLFITFINICPLLFYKKPKVKTEGALDAIIILGFPASEDGTPSPIMRERVIKAAELFKNRRAGHIICSGGSVYNKYTEAEVMAGYARSLGIPESCMIKEDKSRNTFENIKNSAEIMRNRGWTSAMIVTSPWHLRRSYHFCLRYDYISFFAAKSNYPKELSLPFIAAATLWEHYLMTKMMFRHD